MLSWRLPLAGFEPCFHVAETKAYPSRQMTFRPSEFFLSFLFSFEETGTGWPGVGGGERKMGEVGVPRICCLLGTELGAKRHD